MAIDRQTFTKIITQKAKDYTYAIGFFLTFSFFIIFVIRPNLINVFSSASQIEELKKIENVYDAQIDTILLIQADLEKYRPDLIYVDEAIAGSPLVNKVLSDINAAAVDNSIDVVRLDVHDINLKSTDKPDLRGIKVEMDCTGTFDEAYAFLQDITNQRRLKVANEVAIARDSEATDSANLNITLQLEGYYL